MSEFYKYFKENMEAPRPPPFTYLTPIRSTSVGDSKNGVKMAPFLYCQLARLAVVQKEQGKGYGEYLLTEAMVRTAAVAESVGIMGLYVDAKD